MTFLFTDVEGSTALLRRLGSDAYAKELARHRLTLREVIDRHHGVEVDTQGDAFFVAFASARRAVAAALSGQEALKAGVIGVRMGLHTGEALPTDEGYVGLDVHRAARIAGVAHGGQVVISAATRQLLGSDVEVRDLGEHERPVRSRASLPTWQWRVSAVGESLPHESARPRYCLCGSRA